VTGTNGKTSTVQLLAQAWELLGRRAATIGTLGAAMHGDELTLNGYTTPPVTRLHELLAGFRDRGATRVGLEVSSHALEERRAAGVEFDAVHFSNLTRDHLDYHGSMEHYAAQKAKIYDLPGKAGAAPLAIGNLDDDFVRSLLERLPAERARVGLSSRGAAGAEIRAEGLRFAITGTTFDLIDEAPDGGRVTVTSPLIGRFNVDNLLAAVAVLRRVDRVPLADAAAVIPSLQPPNGRMWRIRPDDSLPTVVVDAGHTPDAMRQALSAIQEYGFGRVISVFGATGSRDAGKRPEMARAVEARSDVVIVTDDDVHDEPGDEIVAQLLGAMADPGAPTVIRDRAAAVEHAIRLAGPEDVVMLLGKGHEPMQIVADHVEIPYSDIETAQNVLARVAAERRR
ncbi:MAG: UDP-N-acetylmuramoyl-L-alanyl-D-glutamate--2,6-diaminopimelate ligase, partial [Microbacteriaceae bacterium]|nr:UDP-N-acetylmuramoyl-L-alanyl-D-glutamate--2,6-diaminopimelate ligase [Microbacteriaceae bacterium]